MSTKYVAVVAALAVVIVAAAAILATADNAFADKKRYSGKSQAVAQANYCGSNSVQLPENVWCQDTASQIQGKKTRRPCLVNKVLEATTTDRSADESTTYLTQFLLLFVTRTPS